MAKKIKHHSPKRPAKTDALAERLSNAIAALKERRKAGRGAGNAELKKKLAARFDKKREKMQKKIDKLKTDRDEWRDRYRALKKSTKQYMRYTEPLIKQQLAGSILRNKTEGQSSNAGGGTPAATPTETK